RSKVFVLRALTQVEIADILRRALTDSDRGLGAQSIEVEPGVLETIARFSNGDARAALNLLELAAAAATTPDGGTVRVGLALVPLQIRKAATRVMKKLEYGKGYKYADNEVEGDADMDCLPPSLQGKQYYRLTERGFDEESRRRIEEWRKARDKANRD